MGTRQRACIRGPCQPTPRSLRLLPSARRLLVLASQRQARRLLSTLHRHTGERRRSWQGELALNRETAQNQANSRQTKRISMYKIIGADQKEYGPVTADQINTWILEGRANHQTLAQAAGTSEWKTLAELPEFAPILSSKYSAPLTGLAAPTLTADAVLARGVGVNIGDCLSRGWRLLLNNLPLFLGVSLVLLLIRFGLGFIPVIGPLVYWIIFGSLYGGFYMTFLKRVRGESAVIGDLSGRGVEVQPGVNGRPAHGILAGDGIEPAGHHPVLVPDFRRAGSGIPAAYTVQRLFGLSHVVCPVSSDNQQWRPARLEPGHESGGGGGYSVTDTTTDHLVRAAVRDRGADACV